MSWATQNCLKNSFIVNVSSSDPPYSLWMEIRPDNLYSSDCTQVKFVSSDPNSHVCLQQINGTSHINDSNVVLLGYDGQNEILNLQYFPSVWLNGELCSKNNALNFQLKKSNNKLSYRPELLYINFRVVHIESPSRVLYMDDYFCDGTYKIRNSSLEILSHINFTPKSTCGLNIIKSVNGNKNMCLFYTLKAQTDRSISWNLYVSTEKYSFDPKHHVFTFNVNSSKTGAWCGNESFVMLIIKRESASEGLNGAFSMLIRDFNGTSEQFVDFINSSNYGVSPTPVSAKSDADIACVLCVPIIVPIAIVFVAVLLIASFTWLMLRHLCHKSIAAGASLITLPPRNHCIADNVPRGVGASEMCCPTYCGYGHANSIIESYRNENRM
ncbi:hypothetical protein Btru_076127 [Bulinus truncatus]|nr:hypothetical protein Btru_076127 [Bulinus truncatus]